MSIENLILITLLVLVLLTAIYTWYTYNSFATLRIRIKEALSSIDIQLKRRIDLIPNLVESVKGYVKHENEVIQAITKARESLMSAKTPKEKAASDSILGQGLKSLFALSEGYPELKASQNFLQLQEELTDTENKVAYSRQFYNSTVREYNTLLATMPSGSFGKIFGFKDQEFFEAEEKAKEPTKVQF